jgi:hypothetical protein
VTFLFDPAYVSQRLSEIAPNSETIAAVLHDGENSWTLAFDNDVALLIEWVDEPRRLMLSADIGKAPGKRAAEVHAAALSYNILWRETGGARICMGGDSSELVLIRELDADTARGGDFAGVLEHFAELVRWWELYVTSEDVGMTAPMPAMVEMAARA